jgi:hypothetical protein
MTATQVPLGPPRRHHRFSRRRFRRWLRWFVVGTVLAGLLVYLVYLLTWPSSGGTSGSGVPESGDGSSIGFK